MPVLKTLSFVFKIAVILKFQISTIFCIYALKYLRSIKVPYFSLKLLNLTTYKPRNFNVPIPSS